MNKKRGRQPNSSPRKSKKNYEKLDLKERKHKSYNKKNVQYKNENKNKIFNNNIKEIEKKEYKNTEFIINLRENEEEINFQNENNEVDYIIPKSIKEIKEEIKLKFLLLTEKEKEIITYKEIEDKFLRIYDLDEDINFFFLKKLNIYYKNNKNIIDQDKEEENNQSNEIASNFFSYLYTLSAEKRKIIIREFNNYFGKNEIFFKKDRQYFHEEPLKMIFNNFICDIFDISKECNELDEFYFPKFNRLYKKYEFPSAKKEFKIPLKFNEEILYLEFILRFKSLFCTDPNGENEKIFYQYNMNLKLLAFNYFRKFFEQNEKDIFGIEYVLFCLFTFFKYYKYYNTLTNTNTIRKIIESNFLECSNFLFQTYEDKKLYINKIIDYIQNIEEYNEYINNSKNTNFNNFVIKIKYNKIIYEFLPEDFYFTGEIYEILEAIKSKTNYNFNYLKKHKFLLFDNNDLNEQFENHLNTILKSPLTKEYINSFNGLTNISIFDNEEIIKEIKENTFWIKFPLQEVSGITDKDIFSVFLNNSFIESINEKYVIEVTSKITTSSQENINHVSRLVLNINDNLIEKKTPIQKAIYKIESYNKLTKKFRDQGDKWEKIIFGNKISNIFIRNALFLLDAESYNLKIEQFREIFKKYQKKFSKKYIQNYFNDLLSKNKNSLLKKLNEIKPINFKNCKDEEWIENSQSIKARIDINNEDETWQSIKVGICGRFYD